MNCSVMNLPKSQALCTPRHENVGTSQAFCTPKDAICHPENICGFALVAQQSKPRPPRRGASLDVIRFTWPRITELLCIFRLVLHRRSYAANDNTARKNRMCTRRRFRQTQEQIDRFFLGRNSSACVRRVSRRRPFCRRPPDTSRNHPQTLLRLSLEHAKNKFIRRGAFV